MKSVLFQKEGPLALLTIDRPKALNALNKSVFDDLESILDEIDKDESLRCAIITGSGEKAFAAGADITEFLQLDKKGGSALSQRGHDIFRRIEICRIPFIAAVNGFALGGGCELTMACQIRIASENARFGQPEVNLGLIPGYGGTQRLPQIVGRGRALELLLTARMIKADEALNIGLVTKVTSQSELLEEARKIAATICEKGPNSIKATIQTVDTFYSNEDGFQAEVDFFGTAMASPECKEGVTAFLEKRKANFS